MLWDNIYMGNEVLSTVATWRAEIMIRNHSEYQTSTQDEIEQRSFRPFKMVRVEKIRLSVQNSGDQGNVQRIAESLYVHGLIQALIVRRQVRTTRAGKKVKEIILVCGHDRLEAALFVGLKRVPCFFLQGGVVEAELVRLGENLWRKNHSVLRRAEMLVEWLSLAATPISGQLDQKKRGRPPGGIAQAARELPVIGRSIEARRKKIQRANRIAALAPEVKRAVVKARLDNNQRLLLQIAKAGNLSNQLRKVDGLKEAMRGVGKKPQPVAAKSAKRVDEDEVNALTRHPSGKVGQGDSENDDESETAVQPETTLLELDNFWQPDGHRLWQYASFEVRQRFIEKLNRTKNRSPSNIVMFIREVMAGRKNVIKGALYEYGKAKGFSTAEIKKVARHLGYRSGQLAGGAKIFRNTDKADRYVRSVAEDELMAGYREKRQQREEWRGRRHWNSSRLVHEEAQPPQSVTLDLSAS